MRSLSLLPFTLLLLVLTGCTAEPLASDEANTSEVDRRKLANVFLVEHYRVEVSSSLLAGMRSHPPGGVLFWNANAADAQTLREVIRTYSSAVKDGGHEPVLFSADYEGGGSKGSPTSLDPRHKEISGVQRFRKGFSALAHPRWLGAAYDYDEALGRELARLHGSIMARELHAVGLVLPLSVVGDVAKNLFAVRGIHTDEKVVAILLSEVLRGFFSEPGMIFNTKHFPGLGDGHGDTHDGIVTIDHDDDTAAAQLLPFEAAMATAAESDPLRLSIMCSHAKYPHYDPVHNTTTSRAILQGLLRDDLGFSGLAISDAMWMGPYGQMAGNALYRIYLESFVAGMDMLMIPGSRYAGALGYFEAVASGTQSASEVAAIEQAFGMSYDEVRDALRARLAESGARLGATRGLLQYAVDATEGQQGDPSELTQDDRARYYAILKQVDPVWESRL